MPTTKKTTPKRAGKTQRLDETPSGPVLVGEVIAAKAKTPTKMGRPTKFTPELGDYICEMAGNGLSMRKIAKIIDIETRTIFQWLRVHPDFQHQYARAKTEETADAMAEHIHNIAEGTLSGEYEPQAARVAIDAYKWTAAKLMPKKYGDKIDMTSGGEKIAPVLVRFIDSGNDARNIDTEGI